VNQKCVNGKSWKITDYRGGPWAEKELWGTVEGFGSGESFGTVLGRGTDERAGGGGTESRMAGGSGQTER